MAIICLFWKKPKTKQSHDFIAEELLASLWDIINTIFLQWILPSLWWHKWIHQEWALLSLALVQEDFPFLHPLAGAKQHLQPFDHDQNFLFLALMMPHSQFFFFLKIKLSSLSSYETNVSFCHFGETSRFAEPSFWALAAKEVFLNVWNYPEALANLRAFPRAWIPHFWSFKPVGWLLSHAWVDIKSKCMKKQVQALYFGLKAQYIHTTATNPRDAKLWKEGRENTRTT